MAPWVDGIYRPSRPATVCCNVCKRVFASDAVPTPYSDGKRVCRDCRHAATLTPGSG